MRCVSSIRRHTGLLPVFLLLLLLLFVTDAHAQGCPSECSCTIDSQNGSRALCTAATISSFPAGIPSPMSVISILGTASQPLGLTSLTGADLAPFGSDLRHVFISYTSMTTLDQHAFSATPHMRIVDLKFNKLQKVPLGTFQGLGELGILDLTGNAGCHLEYGALEGLSSLRELYLGGLGLASLSASAFRGLDQLLILDLHDNNLDDVGGTLLTSLSALTSLDLSGNQLSSLPAMEIRPLLSRVPRVALGRNPWRCNCHVSWLKQLPQVLFHKDRMASEQLVVCASPSRLAYRSLLHVPDSELVCEPPRVVRCLPSSPVTLNRGEPLTLKCTVTGDPYPVLTWFSPDKAALSAGTMAGRRSVDANGTLTLSAAEEQDSGTWKLEALNSEGADSGNITVVVEIPSTTTAATTSPVTPSNGTTPSSVQLSPITSGDEGLDVGVIAGAVAGGLTLLALTAILVYAVHKRATRGSKVDPFPDSISFVEAIVPPLSTRLP